MAIRESKWHIGYIDPFWDNAHHILDYESETFNNSDDIIRWMEKGYTAPYVGDLCDMRKLQTWYAADLTQIFTNIYGIEDVGTSFYRMRTGVVLPPHRDTYKKYRELFNVEINEIQRIIVFLEDWQSGHYFEIEGKPIVSWKRGDYIWWRGDAEHMAANIGESDRYTMQITGHDGLQRFK